MNELIRTPDDQARFCTNCGTPLQGEWCHVCGQSSKNVLRHLPGLVEDAADVLLNLDGRVARTLPMLYFFPGRLTREYLAGRRIRYITPFRLMFVLCLMSFFFLHAVLKLDLGPASADRSAFASAQTPQAVLQQLDTLSAQLDDTGKVPVKTPGVKDVVDMSRHALAFAALQRMQQVLPDHAPTAAQAARIDALERLSLSGADSTASLERRLATSLAVTDALVPPGAERDRRHRLLQQRAGARLARLHAARTGPKARDGKAQAHGLEAWFQRRVQRLKTNAMRMNGSAADRDMLVGQIFSALPQSMLVLVPVFALVLQLLYLFHHRLYMEHLIVSLHSHAFLFLSLLLLIGLEALRGVLPGWAAMPVGWLRTLVWLWIPVYLLLMQKRVYAQGWGLTLFKYLVTGTVYVVLLSMTVGAAALVGLAG